MGRACDVRAGLEIGPGLRLRTREQTDGTWLAWIEQDGLPIEEAPGHPRTFRRPSCYQAQCEAARWLRAQGTLVSPPRCGSESSEELRPA